jgi:hypothetical protein
MAQTRRRDLPLKRARGTLYQTRYELATGKWVKNYTPITGALMPPSVNGTQVTVSENHPEWRKRKSSRFSGDIGGDFSSTKTFCSWDEDSTKVLHAAVPFSPYLERYTYIGPVLCRGLSGPMPPSISSGNTTLDAWGAKAVAEAKPTNALVDLSTTLGEILGPGGIPRMIGRAAFWHEGVESALKTSADDFLNVQFSLTPIVKDMVGFANVVYLFQKLVKQYERDAGKVVRRRWSFEPITTEQNSTFATGQIPYIDPNQTACFGGRTGQVILRRKTELRRWFSGAFTYHLPSGYSSRRDVMSFGPEAQKLLGLEPTPETLWNLAPWSWAVDWFTSAGDVVSNISDWSTDGLVMRYGYLMEHSRSSDSYFWSGSSYESQPSPVHFIRESKVRRRANPFGFGLTWGGLSPRQLAIAAALGITRW